MPVLKYRDPTTGTWVALSGTEGTGGGGAATVSRHFFRGGPDGANNTSVSVNWQDDFFVHSDIIGSNIVIQPLAPTRLKITNASIVAFAGEVTWGGISSASDLTSTFVYWELASMHTNMIIGERTGYDQGPQISLIGGSAYLPAGDELTLTCSGYVFNASGWSAGVQLTITTVEF